MKKIFHFCYAARQNITRFQALTVLSEQKVARFHCLHESVRKMEPCRSKSGPAFFRSQTCTLSRSKIRPVPPVPCKRKVEPCKFLSVQKFVRTCVNGALDDWLTDSAHNRTAHFSEVYGLKFTLKFDVLTSPPVFYETSGFRWLFWDDNLNI